ncbi:MAG: single-stranded-DNA-specific exonuclease, single-stranded-DNA-specific exonuclease [Candidatus Parcubacteria bacterium]|jgi:single-stranded-DNA-specific exonuclease
MQSTTISSRVHDILKKRGFDGDALDAFLKPDFIRDTHSPQLFVDMDKAVERTMKAIAAGEKIAVYADFDADGIPGAVVMHDVFRLLGYDNFIAYIPDRDNEGFGFHKHAVDALASDGVSLIITIDVGAASVETIAYAQARGVDVIVTDHHEYDKLRINAFACVHPRHGGYPFEHLCGAAVAYKFACALFATAQAQNIGDAQKHHAEATKWMLDMVAIATIADMVPLLGENRTLARFGIQVLQKSRRPGMRALCAVGKLRQPMLTEEDIGFSIAPRVNAASRMSSPRIAYDLFTTTQADEAERLARELDALNTKRKATTSALTKNLRKRIEALPKLPDVIVLGSYEYKPALLGSVATTLVARYDRPVCLWGREQTGAIKGSARTNGTTSVLTLFTHAGSILTHAGGHDNAGGFAVDEAQLHQLDDTFQHAYMQCATPKQERVDLCGILPVSLSEVGMTLVKELDQLRPFGEGNPKPRFQITGTLSSIAAFGKEGAHTELMLTNTSGVRVRAYRFFVTPDELPAHVRVNTTISLCGTPERNAFMPQRVEFRFDHIAPIDKIEGAL